MNTFEIEIFEGHPIIKSNDDVILIDTGAPSTINASDNLNFCSERFNCTTNYMGLNVDGISEMLGKRITTLLGTDVLSKYKILIDYKNKNIVFDKQDFEIVGDEINISNFMGVPVIGLSIENQEHKFFLDSGAKISYLPKNITNNYNSIGVREDFYPGAGTFVTNCYKISTSIRNKTFDAVYGNLPTLLQMSLGIGGVNGIIGFDFFNNFKVVLDLSKGKITLL